MAICQSIIAFIHLLTGFCMHSQRCHACAINSTGTSLARNPHQQGFTNDYVRESPILAVLTKELRRVFLTFPYLSLFPSYSSIELRFRRKLVQFPMSLISYNWTIPKVLAEIFDGSWGGFAASTELWLSLALIYRRTSSRITHRIEVPAILKCPRDGSGSSTLPLPLEASTEFLGLISESGAGSGGSLDVDLSRVCFLYVFYPASSGIGKLTRLICRVDWYHCSNQEAL